MPADASVGILRLRMWLAARRDARLLRAQLPLVVLVLAAYVRAGRSLRQAVADAAADVPDPSRRALHHAASAIALGAPPGEALGVLGDDSDVAHLVALVEMQIRTGGDLALLLDRMADVLRAREELRRAAGSQFCPRCVAALERVLAVDTVAAEADSLRDGPLLATA